MKQKYIRAYMDVAKRFAELSSAVRLQVGAIVVKEDRIISIGYNGMPPGWSNECEYKDYYPEGYYDLKTKPEVIHAEANAIAKLAKSTESGKDATMFLTHAPCIDCAKQIFTAGIQTVYYEKDYRSNDGLKFLSDCGVEVIKTSEPSDGSERG
jgi:dCMP deaminase